MAYAYDYIKGLIKVAADASSDSLYKWLLGDSANDPVRYPPAWTKSSQMRERGRLWEQLLFPAILSHIGIELDTHGICWALITTNATGVAPTVVSGNRITTVTKDEPSNGILVNFDVPYTGANDFVFFTAVDNTGYHQYKGVRNVSYVSLGFVNEIGGLQPINDQTICFISVGLR